MTISKERLASAVGIVTGATGGAASATLFHLPLSSIALAGGLAAVGTVALNALLRKGYDTYVVLTAGSSFLRK